MQEKAKASKMGPGLSFLDQLPRNCPTIPAQSSSSYEGCRCQKSLAIHVAITCCYCYCVIQTKSWGLYFHQSAGNLGVQVFAFSRFALGVQGAEEIFVASVLLQVRQLQFQHSSAPLIKPDSMCFQYYFLLRKRKNTHSKYNSVH